jgi:peptidoglycan/xylan/chitin deacetylase (PgdA/CDA1 family)
LTSVALCYHGVSEDWPAALSVTPAQLEEHVAFLAGKGYRGVTLADAVATPHERTVAITFDDAYTSVLEHAFPILSRAGFRASVFAPTGFIGSREPMSWDGVDQWLDTAHRDELLPLSWEQLGALAEAGWEVGSHTRSHPRLPEIGGEELDRELGDSRREIEDRLGRPCRSLAYPYGARDERVIEAARTAGYEIAASLGQGRLPPPTNPLDWPRLFVNHSDDGRRFRLKLSPAMRRLMASRAWDWIAALRARASA